MMRMANMSVLLVAFVATVMLAGCGEKKCFFVTSDGAGLKKGDRVVWYDAF